MDGKDLFGIALKLGGAAYNAYKDYSNTNSEQPQQAATTGGTTRLQGQLKFCSYSEQSTQAVKVGANEALRVFPDLTSEVLSFYENNMKKSFIELKGKVPVNYKGSTYGVNMSMMLPEGFPKQAPFVRIINENHEKYLVQPFYERMRSHTDPNSYLLTNLQTLASWKGRPECVIEVIQQATYMMSQTFPFKKKKAPEPGQQQPPEFNSKPFASNPGFQPGYPGQYGGYVAPPSSGQDFAQGGFVAPQGYNNQPNYGVNYPGAQNNGYGGVGNVGFNTPAQSKATVQRDKYLSQTHVFLNQSLQTTDTLRNGRNVLWRMSQNIHAIDRAVLQQNQLLKERTSQLTTLIRNNEQGNEVDYKSLVVPQDPFSAQLLELAAENKAWIEASAWLQSQFGSDKVPLETFLKLARKIEQERFQTSYMLKKCLKQRGR